MTHTYKTARHLITSAIILAPLGAVSASALPAFMAVQASTTTAPSQLVLNVSGYDAVSGQIMVALYNDEADFDDEAAPLRDAKVSVNGSTTEVVFDNLSVGEYAFKVFHDVNGNGALDTNELGIPSEPYGFSKDASDPFSAPEFEESKFSLPAGTMRRNVSLD